MRSEIDIPLRPRAAVQVRFGCPDRMVLRRRDPEASAELTQPLRQVREHSVRREPNHLHHPRLPAVAEANLAREHSKEKKVLFRLLPHPGLRFDERRLHRDHREEAIHQRKRNDPRKVPLVPLHPAKRGRESVYARAEPDEAEAAA